MRTLEGREASAHTGVQERARRVTRFRIRRAFIWPWLFLALLLKRTLSPGNVN